MSSPAHGELAYNLGKFYFGQEVALVIKKLFTYDQLTLQNLHSELPHLKREDLKKALLVPVKYQLVDYVKRVKNFRSQYEYTLSCQRLFSFFRIPRLIQLIGDKQGKNIPNLLTCISEKALVEKEILLKLVIDRSPKNETNIKQEQSETDLNIPLQNDLDKLLKLRYVVMLGNSLCLNIERLSRVCRDNLICETIHGYYHKEPRIKALAQSILSITSESTSENATITAPVPFTTLTDTLVPNFFSDRAQLETYLARLTTETNNRFIASLGLYQGKGQMYAIDLGLVIDYLVKEYLSSMVTSRFGPRCCRVFRLLLRRGSLLLKQIEESVMLPAKDVREYSYMLIKEGLVRNQQVPKTPDLAPSKSLFIMYVELDQVVYQATDHCCRAMSNLLIRYEHELTTNKTILDRSKAVQELLRSEGLEENSPESKEIWSQYFNSHELAQLEQVNKNLHRILMAKAQVDEMLFLLETWLNMRPDLRDE